MDYSIVIPFYNEELSVEELLQTVISIMDSLNGNYEILAINDGSTDKTRGELEKMRNMNSSVIPINFFSRKGQMACLTRGFQKANGHTVISMDGDLQDDPRLIPSMLEAFKKSQADVLCGWRTNRKGSILVMLFSRFGNFFQKMFLGVPIHDISCTFRIYKKKAAKSINLEKEGLHRFLLFFFKKAGFSLQEKKIPQNVRKYGHSKYSSLKALQTVKLFFEILYGKY